MDSNSASVDDFIKANQPRVAAQSIESLASANDNDLPALLHRLTGTLLTYGIEPEGNILGAIKDAQGQSTNRNIVQAQIAQVIELLRERLEQ